MRSENATGARAPAREERGASAADHVPSRRAPASGMLATTILAVSTAPGVGSRAVLRLSGPRAVTAVMALAVDGHVIEDVAGFSGVELELRFGGFDLLVWAVRFRAPRSYTREEMLELHVVSCTPLVAALCRALLRDEDVRWAGPGEFTLRAFTRGRIDLSQAEAVARLIAATGEEEARAARRALAGDLGREVESVVNVLTEALALIEAGIDFADEDLPEVAPDILLERLDDVGARITSLRASTSLRLPTPALPMSCSRACRTPESRACSTPSSVVPRRSFLTWRERRGIRCEG